MPNIIVRSRIRDFAELDGKPLSVSEEFEEALAKKVVQIIKEACRRARENNRNTLMARDL
ncbi:MAG: hypothetical protein QXW00_01670 [Candidatus Woesearchaeota archaeon]